jgi:hypothetical protein
VGDANLTGGDMTSFGAGGSAQPETLAAGSEESVTLRDRTSQLKARLTSPGQLRRTTQRKQAMRRSAAAMLAAAAVVAVGLLARSNPTTGSKHLAVAAGPSAYPARFAGLPAAGTPVSLPADGRLLASISPASGESWNIYADGRLIWQRWTSRTSGDPLVIPDGADPFQTTYVQQRLTPAGAEALVSKILAIGHRVGLFRQDSGFVNSAYDSGDKVDWDQVCNNGHLVNVQVLPTGISNDPTETAAEIHALAQVRRLLGDPSRVLPATAWTDRTIRPYVPARYELVWDRSGPDPSKLPSPARDALEPLIQAARVHDAVATITTDQARALLAAFAQAGVKNVGNHAAELDFQVPAVRIPTTVLEVLPELPSSSLTDNDRC